MVANVGVTMGAVAVGAGPSSADVSIEWSDGFVAEFIVLFDDALSFTGLDALELIEANTALSLTLTNYSWGTSIDGIAFDSHFNPGWDGSQYWNYWTKESNTNWGFAPVGATSRYLTDGASDGWFYTDSQDPSFVPEPLTMSLLAMGGVAVVRRKRCRN